MNLIDKYTIILKTNVLTWKVHISLIKAIEKLEEEKNQWSINKVSKARLERKTACIYIFALPVSFTCIC
jgi:hypothetical protein